MHYVEFRNHVLDGGSSWIELMSARSTTFDTSPSSASHARFERSEGVSECCYQPVQQHATSVHSSLRKRSWMPMMGLSSTILKTRNEKPKRRVVCRTLVPRPSSLSAQHFGVLLLGDGSRVARHCFPELALRAMTKGELLQR